MSTGEHVTAERSVPSRTFPVAIGIGAAIVVLAGIAGALYAFVWHSTQPLEGMVRDVQITTASIIGIEAAILWLILRRGYARNSEELRTQSRALGAALSESELAYDQTLQAFANALYVRDRETEGHAVRVARIMELLTRELDRTDVDTAALRRGALLHDVGKIGIPDTVLDKDGDLTDEEWKLVKLHPVYGARILAGVSFLRSATDIVRHHHERWDGSGYPDGLAGEDIPIGARIFAVAAAFDAMTSERPYRPARTIEEARREVVRGGGTQFDPSIIVAFLRIPAERFEPIRDDAPRTRPFAAAGA